MKRIRTRTAAAAAAAVALTGGGVTAWIATGNDAKDATSAQPTAAVSSSDIARARGELAVAASYLGLSRSRLRAEERAGKSLAQIAVQAGRSRAGLVHAIVAARSAALAAAERAGKITAHEEQRRLGLLQRQVAASVDRVRRGAGALADTELQAAARYLGLPSPRLREELRSGRTAAAVAEATPGRSVAGLVSALVAAREAQLQAAVRAGRLSRERVAMLARRLRRNLEAAVHTSLE